MTKQSDKLPGRVIGQRHTPNQNDAPEYYTEQPRQRSSVQHTPGPWTVDSQRPDLSRELCVWAGDVIVAEATQDHNTPEQAQANACLIAAAPDLLATLRHIEAEAGISLDYDTIAEVAQAAIAKAEGRAL